MKNNALNLLLEKQAELANELNKASDAYYNGKRKQCQIINESNTTGQSDCFSIRRQYQR